MRLVAWGLWLASIQVAQAATSGRFGHRSFRKRQAVEEPPAPKFEGLRLSYVTETTTEKVTETQVIVQTAQGDAVAAAETVTVTINAPAVTVTVNAPAETVTINAPPITITEVAAAPPPITVTETITSAVAQPFTVVEVSPITIVEVSPITIVEVSPVTVPGEAPPPVTLIETVQAPADSAEDNKTGGPGVTTIPIAESALPTTTFSEDPLAESRVEESSAAEETTSANESATSAQESATSAEATSAEESTAPAQESTASAEESATSAQESATSAKESTASSKASTTAAKESTSEVASVPNDTTEAAPTTEAPAATSAPALPVMESNIVLGPSPSNEEEPAAPAQPTGGSNSLNLGDLAPDATADAGTALPAVTAEPEAEEPRTRAPINISTLSLSSAINLGNLGGGGAGLLKARATNAP
ncbi:hypothetical protein CEP54_003392 [Fusarium duplospermum]|uniref:Uncharacterized protein n=1 Tax=Fusarium duplospermum TaxID=1325734 RepID=A0A428QPK5_9HYPO|nr:hypothetical protein CEP54_003392 [Fusarium duplospermum]